MSNATNRGSHPNTVVMIGVDTLTIPDVADSGANCTVRGITVAWGGGAIPLAIGGKAQLCCVCG